MTAHKMLEYLRALGYGVYASRLRGYGRAAGAWELSPTTLWRRRGGQVVDEETYPTLHDAFKAKGGAL